MFDLRTKEQRWSQHLDLSTADTSLKAQMYAPPTLVDLNHDGKMEIVVGTSMGFLYVLDWQVGGWVGRQCEGAEGLLGARRKLGRGGRSCSLVGVSLLICMRQVGYVCTICVIASTPACMQHQSCCAGRCWTQKQLEKQWQLLPVPLTTVLLCHWQPRLASACVQTRLMTSIATPSFGGFHP